jgi:hypothetical protein
MSTSSGKKNISQQTVQVYWDLDRGGLNAEAACIGAQVSLHSYTFHHVIEILTMRWRPDQGHPGYLAAIERPSGSDPDVNITFSSTKSTVF